MCIAVTAKIVSILVFMQSVVEAYACAVHLKWTNNVLRKSKQKEYKSAQKVVFKAKKVLIFAKMYCGSECLSLGPPPDWILHMPPPPLPTFFEDLHNLTPPAPCVMSQCPTVPAIEDLLFPGVEYHELPRHEPATGDETWFMVLITCCTTVLCVAALLALFLFRCRHSRGCKSSTGKSSAANALYSGATIDSRVLWAALTPRGTRHFVADTYPHEETDENLYECVDPPLYKLPPPEDLIARHFDMQYEDPAPLIDAYVEDYFKTGMDSRGRPMVSSPTKIDRPNLPPLNLQPRTLRRTPNSRRISDATEKVGI